MNRKRLIVLRHRVILNTWRPSDAEIYDEVEQLPSLETVRIKTPPSVSPDPELYSCDLARGPYGPRKENQ